MVETHPPLIDIFVSSLDTLGSSSQALQQVVRMELPLGWTGTVDEGQPLRRWSGVDIPRWVAQERWN